MTPTAAAPRLLAAVLFLTAAAQTAPAQYGRGLPAYRSGLSEPYQFGFFKTYEVVVVNAALQDVEFRLKRIKNERRQWSAPTAAWVVPAGTAATLDLMAIDVEGDVYTRRGVRIPVEPRFGERFATFYVDEDLIREYERRDPRGSIVVRESDAKRNPDLEKSRITRITDETKLLLRGLDLLKAPHEYPGGEKFRSLPGGGFPQGYEKLLTIDEIEIGGDANSGRIRQPGERPIVIQLVRAGGEVPRGYRYRAKIGHDLAHRTETGEVDGEGLVRLFAARDENVEIEMTVSPATGSRESTFTVDPSVTDRFRVTIP